MSLHTLLSAWMCSVCFGDPASSIRKGAAAGVLFLLGVVVLLLSGIAATLITWARRASAGKEA